MAFLDRLKEGRSYAELKQATQDRNKWKTDNGPAVRQATTCMTAGDLATGKIIEYFSE